MISITDPRRKGGDAQNFILVNEVGLPLKRDDDDRILSSARGALLNEAAKQSQQQQGRSQSSTSQQQQQAASTAWSAASGNFNSAQSSVSVSSVSPFWRQMELEEQEYKSRMESALVLLRHAVLQCIVPIQSAMKGFLARKKFRRDYILVRILQNHLVCRQSSTVRVYFNMFILRYVLVFEDLHFSRSRMPNGL